MADIEKVIPIQKARPIVKNPPTNPEELRDFFNDGGLYGLAKPMDYLLSEIDEPDEESRVRILDEDPRGKGALQAYWVYGDCQYEHRQLVITSDLSNLASRLFLRIPVDSEGYKMAYGYIGASYAPKTVRGRTRGHNYIKDGPGMEVGERVAAVKVQQAASKLLLQACGVSKIEDLEELAIPELTVA